MASSAILHLLHSHKILVKSSLLILFFIVSPPFYAETRLHSSIHSRRALVEEHHANAVDVTSSGANSSECSSASTRGPLFNYASLHYCYLKGFTPLSVMILVGVVVLQFYVLAVAAELHFSRVVSRLAALLRLSPSMGGVTVLALGNGAPDLCASLAALRSDNARIGLGAILSAGAFVSAFVVGNVALTAAPFSVKPFPFVRDVFFYLTAATTLFYVYLSGVIFLWQAVGLVFFYFFFVAVVFWTDRMEENGGGGDSALEMSGGGFDRATRVDEGFDRPPNWKKVMANEVSFQADLAEKTKAGSPASCWICCNLGKFTQLWELPVKLVLKLLIPSICTSEWSRFYTSANIVLCPLALLYFCSSFVPLDYPLVFIIPKFPFPLWIVVLAQSSCIGLTHYLIVDEPPDREQILSIVVAFVMSVCSISFVAGELLGCLAALGMILKLPPALLGLTVLAWGNSVGDLVADVAVAKAGQPAMAMAGCYAGPMFNMLIGFGLALVIRTAHTYPSGYYLRFHVSIVVAFCFLFMSLLGSLLVITWSRFQVTRLWGSCLIALYIIFVIVSLMVAKMIR